MTRRSLQRRNCQSSGDPSGPHPSPNPTPVRSARSDFRLRHRQFVVVNDLRIGVLAAHDIGGVGSAGLVGKRPDPRRQPVIFADIDSSAVRQRCHRAGFGLRLARPFADLRMGGGNHRSCHDDRDTRRAASQGTPGWLRRDLGHNQPVGRRGRCWSARSGRISGEAAGRRPTLREWPLPHHGHMVKPSFRCGRICRKGGVHGNLALCGAPRPNPDARNAPPRGGNTCTRVLTCASLACTATVRGGTANLQLSTAG